MTTEEGSDRGPAAGFEGGGARGRKPVNVGRLQKLDLGKEMGFPQSLQEEHSPAATFILVQ